ncbi:MAG: hypothetical protein AAFY28_07205, partial [Actinomycetota bacterium]
MTAVDDRLELDADEPRSFWSQVGRIVVIISLVGLAIFWVWALFFASKEAVNKVDDREWAARAESICAEVRPQLAELDRQESADLNVRADLVVTSTDLLSQMLDDVIAVPPSD